MSRTAYGPAMRMNRVVLLVTGILVAVASQTNCSSSDDNSTGKGGSGGSLIGTDGGSTGQAGSAAAARARPGRHRRPSCP